MATELPASVAAFRAEYRASAIGPGYRGWAHFAFTSLASVAVIVLAASRVHRVSWAEWLVLPGAFLFANVGEYFGHRGPMHHQRAGLGLLYRRHTQQHHHFFTHDAMSYESSRDFKMVLFPPVMLFFFLGVLATPFGAVVFLVASPNAGWLFVATAMAYFLTYEWCHFAYHLPPDGALGSLPVLRKLRQHHRRHHDLTRMGRVNFNITFPICDWIFGTLDRDGVEVSAGGLSAGSPGGPRAEPPAG